MLRNLYSRDLRPERMDQPGLADDRHRQALEGLARTNRLSGSAGTLWKQIRRHVLTTVTAERAAKGSSGKSGETPQKLSLCDVASGAGDVAVALARRARRAGVKLRVTGYDVSPVAVEAARERARAAGPAARFAVRDVLSGEPESFGRFDIVTCSLFLHHLSDGKAEELLRRMARMTRRLLLVSDLARGRLGYTLAQVAVHLVSRSDIVHDDGPQSVAAAFTLDEARRLAERAGLANAEVSRSWPLRYVIAWKPGA
jgi:2-polyprenyl-3-methyl-5-hydroxy-6-metoxy-1,4-benzoquinol methylase